MAAIDLRSRSISLSALISAPATILKCVANLQGHLDAALRSSSAAIEAADILRRVDVRLPHGKTLEGDLGWDVFALQYHVDEGPLGAVLSPDTMAGDWKLDLLTCKLGKQNAGAPCIPQTARTRCPCRRLPANLPPVVDHQACGGRAGAVLEHHQQHAARSQHD